MLYTQAGCSKCHRLHAPDKVCIGRIAFTVIGPFDDHEVAHVCWDPPPQPSIRWYVLDPAYGPLIERLFANGFEGLIGPPPGKRINAEPGTQAAFEAGCAALIDRGCKLIAIVED